MMSLCSFVIRQDSIGMGLDRNSSMETGIRCVREDRKTGEKVREFNQQSLKEVITKLHSFRDCYGRLTLVMVRKEYLCLRNEEITFLFSIDSVFHLRSKVSSYR
jgi:hypothetical protein